MIVVETKDPVKYSNLTAEEKQARRTQRGKRLQGALRRADESGLLQAGKNLLLGQGGAGSGSGSGSGSGTGGKEQLPLPDPNPAPTGMKPALKWTLIIGGILAVGVVAYMVIKKKANK